MIGNIPAITPKHPSGSSDMKDYVKQLWEKQQE
jgi:hypothetical protein